MKHGSHLGWRPWASKTQNPEQPAISYEDVCRLSRFFNEVASLGNPQDERINEWLKAQIAARRPA